jgi:hypothetical protein
MAKSKASKTAEAPKQLEMPITITAMPQEAQAKKYKRMYTPHGIAYLAEDVGQEQT